MSARLSLEELTDPDASDAQRAKRIGAMFPDWLACFTHLPVDYTARIARDHARTLK